jgi:hypothetical protein
MANPVQKLVRDAQRLIRERPAVVVGGGVLVALGATFLSRQTAAVEGEALVDGEAAGLGTTPTDFPTYSPPTSYPDTPPGGDYYYPDPGDPYAPEPAPPPAPTPLPTVCGTKPGTPPPRGWRWVCAGGRWIVQPILPAPGKPAPAPKPKPKPKPAPAPAPGGAYYVVRRGDTLTRIAARFRTSVARLLKLNPSIKNANLIYAGQRIRVR